MNLRRTRNMLIAVLLLALTVIIKTDAKPYIANVLKENDLAATERDDEGMVKFTKFPPQTIEYEIGTVAEVECEALGSSDLNVQWVPGNMAELDVIDNYTPNPATIVKIRSVLVIEHLKQKETFSCIATSLHTGKQVITKTTVIPKTHDNLSENENETHKVKKQRHLRSPKIIKNYSLFMGAIGSSMTLPCQTMHSNHHGTKKHWINFDNNIIDDENDERFSVSHNGDLIIKDLQWKDMGLYKCIAENSYGFDTANTFVYPVLDDCKYSKKFFNLLIEP